MFPSAITITNSNINFESYDCGLFGGTYKRFFCDIKNLVRITKRVCPVFLLTV